MPVLRKSAHALLDHRIASGVVCLARSPEPFADVRSARQEISEWGRAMSALPFAQLGILLDWRQAPMMHDPELLREVVSRTDALARTFARQALLLASPLGALQASRLSRVHGSQPVVFTDEAEAWSYLMAR